MKKSYKVIFLGNSAVGKTSLICNYLINGMTNQEPTIGIDFFSSNIPIILKNGEKKIVNCQLWDTAGQEKFRSLIKVYLRNSFIAVIVYAINDKKSFETLKRWVDDFRSSSGNGSNVIIVSNKKDLRKEGDEEFISDEEGEAFAKKINARFCTSSALCKADIEDLISGVKSIIAQDILENPHLESDKGSMIDIKSKERRGCC